MEDYDVRSAASILASVKEQEARFEQLTRALEEERRNVTLQLERANLPPNPPTSQPLAWQQVVMQVNDASMLANPSPAIFNNQLAKPCVCPLPTSLKRPSPAPSFHLSKLIPPSCLLMGIASHHWWDSIISLFNFSVIWDTCSLCLYPLSWLLCNNLPCGDSSLKASWWDSTSHSVFPRLLLLRDCLPSNPISFCPLVFDIVWWCCWLDVAFRPALPSVLGTLESWPGFLSILADSVGAGNVRCTNESAVIS